MNLKIKLDGGIVITHDSGYATITRNSSETVTLSWDEINRLMSALQILLDQVYAPCKLNLLCGEGEVTK